VKIWDVRPQQLDYNGKTIEMFNRGAVAKALNREVVTIRSMERKGVLCHPRLKDVRGRWLYTRGQIEDLIQLAKEEEVLDPRFRRPFSDRFIREAHAILSALP
jgi:hypothetical protein